MTVAAIVPVWNGRGHLERLLDSLAKQTRPADAILAVDNGSTDGAAELARERGARVIAMGRNAGFAAAMNRGIVECAPLKPEWIAALNSDVELAPDYLEKLAAADGWFATGKLLNPATGRIDGTFDAVCRGGTAWRVGWGRADEAMFSQRRTIASAPWTAALFRSTLLERVGLLEERFESYLEDVDFGLRCAAEGLAGVYEPSAAGWHLGSAALGRWHPETVRRMARNQIFLLARHYPGRRLRGWARPILAAQLLWAAVALRHGTGLAWTRGMAQGLAGFRAMRQTAKPIGENCLLDILPAQERLIRQVQEATGYDAYWRWYFRLAGETASGT